MSAEAKTGLTGACRRRAVRPSPTATLRPRPRRHPDHDA